MSISWLVQVVEVVRHKVHEIAVKTWKRQDVDHVTLYRAFNRVFNRMTSNRGQGLWDCLVDDRSVQNQSSHVFTRRCTLQHDYTTLYVSHYCHAVASRRWSGSNCFWIFAKRFPVFSFTDFIVGFMMP